MFYCFANIEILFHAYFEYLWILLYTTYLQTNIVEQQ